jgi:hypothetical protein
MAEKKKERTDSERRARQSERLSRLLRALRCILGPGRWDAESLARELEVSPRTVHRIMQTLSMSGVPWYYCKENECYRVRPGFKFPGIEPASATPELGQNPNRSAILAKSRRLLADSEKFLAALRDFCTALGDQPEQNTL